jgi:hypothetical protein
MRRGGDDLYDRLDAMAQLIEMRGRLPSPQV